MTFGVQTPIPFYVGLDGQRLQDGSLYFGAPNLNPETNPITVYWDEALTQPAAQPVKTINGMPSRNGTPSVLFATSDHSLTIRDSQGRLVQYARSALEFTIALQLANESGNPAFGANMVGSIYPGAGSEAVKIAARLGETVSARFYGNKAAGTRAEYTAQVQAAANYAISQGGSLYFGQGVHEINDITTTGNLRMYGDGAGVTIIRLRGSKHRWRAILNQADDILIVSGITFETDAAPEPTFNQADPNCGLYVSYTLTGFDNRDGRRVFTDDVEFRGQNLASHGWACMMWLQNINGSVHVAPWYRGIAVNGTDDGAQASNTVSKLGVQIDGAEFPTDHRFVSPTAYSLDLVINSTGGTNNTEGITIDKGVFVNCGMVCEWAPNPGGRPGFKFLNCHANTYRGIVKLTSVQQAQIEGGEIYHNPGSASNWIGYELINVQDATLRGNQYFRYLDNGSAFTTKGIRVNDIFTKNIIIDDEIMGGTFTRLDTGIEIAATVPTGEVTIGNNIRWNGNYRIGDVVNLGINAQVMGVRTLLARRTNPQPISNGTPIILDWDTLLEDTTGLWPDVSGAFTIPAGRNIKRVRVTATVVWDANATGTRLVRIYGGPIVQGFENANAPSVNAAATTVTATFNVTAGQTISVEVLQNSGVTLNVTGVLTQLCIEVLT